MNRRGYEVKFGKVHFGGRAGDQLRRDADYLALPNANLNRIEWHPSKMHRYFTASLERREACLVEHPVRWQAAPTGLRARRSYAVPPVGD